MTGTEANKTKEPAAAVLTAEETTNPQNPEKQPPVAEQGLATSAPTATANAESRKRKRSTGGANALQEAYAKVSFAPLEPTGRPDRPDFFFSSSYTVVDSDNREGTDGQVCAASVSIEVRQIVHNHVNGLCMVTVGELSESLPPSMEVKSIRFLAGEAPPCSNAAKRKRQAQMLRGKGTINRTTGVVEPSTVIAELVVGMKLANDTNDNDTDDIIVPLRACVWGTILELNTNLLSKPRILLDDPLLDG